MPKKTTKKENSVFVLHYYYDNDNVGSGIHGVYASLAAAKAALQRIIDGAPLLVEGNTVYDPMHRYDPDDPRDWEIAISGNKTYYLIATQGLATVCQKKNLTHRKLVDGLAHRTESGVDIGFVLR